jgi:uncharacterized protein (DUF1697 family)
MPSRFIALLRGINVGTAKRVAMADLRELVESLGYRDVRTLLNSGNVVFSAPSALRGDHGTRLEKSFAKRFGFSSRIIVLSSRDLDAIVSADPLGRVATDARRYLVTVLRGPADRARIASLAKRKWLPESLALGPNAAYLWCPKGVLESAVAAAINKELGDSTTTRNWATMNKLNVLASAPDSE